MVNTVNRIPSINLPLTNEQGVIHPIWYEFLRSFISSVGDLDTSGGADNTVTAGNGIEGTGSVSTVNVGEGEGIAVNANDVAVDITGQINAQAAPEDEVLIADASDGSRIRKTSLRDVAALSIASPGGTTTQMQYNNNEVFGGDSGFTTNGLGSVDIIGDLDVDSINLNGNTISTPNSSTPLNFIVPAGGLNQFLFTQSGAGTSAVTLESRSVGAESTLLIRSDSGATSSVSDSKLSFATNAGTAEWTQGLFDSQDDDFIFAHGTGLNTGKIFTVTRADDYFIHNSNMRRKTTAGITASTTQTQGQGALTADVNEVSVVANINDTVTLPGAQAGSTVYISNNGANILQIFPASGDNLGAGLNTSTVLVSGGHAVFVAHDTTNWEQFI